VGVHRGGPGSSSSMVSEWSRSRRASRRTGSFEKDDRRSFDSDSREVLRRQDRRRARPLGRRLGARLDGPGSPNARTAVSGRKEDRKGTACRPEEAIMQDSAPRSTNNRSGVRASRGA